MQQIPMKIMEFVEQREQVTAKDLENEFGYTRKTASTYLSSLASHGSLHRISRGIYAQGKPAQPLAPSLLAQEAYTTIHRRLPELPVVVWDVYLLSAFSHHSIMKSPVFIEVPRGYLDAARDALLGDTIHFRDLPVFDLEKVDIQEVFDHTPILLLERQERYALIQIDNIITVRPERAWVDLLILTEKRGYPFDLGALGEMLVRMIRDFDFNPKLFLRYAQRRHRKPLLETFLWKLQRNGLLKGITLHKHSGYKRDVEKLMRGARYEATF